MKRAIMVIPIVFLLVSPVFLHVNATTYYGSKNSNVYHYGSCHYVSRIKSYNLVTFSSAQDAVNRGYRPCKVCNPPLPSADNPEPTPSVPEITTLCVFLSLVAVTGIAIVAKKHRLRHNKREVKL